MACFSGRENNHSVLEKEKSQRHFPRDSSIFTQTRDKEFRDLWISQWFISGINQSKCWKI